MKKVSPLIQQIPLLVMLLMVLVHGGQAQVLMESESTTSPRFFTIRIALSILLGTISGLLTAVFLALTIRCFILYLNTTPILNGPVVFYPTINPTTLHFALDCHQNQLLGSPTSAATGAYYRAALDNGFTVAVKRLDPFQIGSPDTRHKASKRHLQHHLQVLAALRHRHLMSLRAYVCESHRFSLVFDYMSHGSLQDALNKVGDNQLRMPWDVRLRIAVGIIKGLKYLHFECTPPILHCNLKPSNVLLDAEFEPKLTDFGLAHLMPKLYTSPNAYRAPETSHTLPSRYTEKSDVFSFGVILGVLVTGREPGDPLFGEATSGGSLGKWLRHMQQAGEAEQALDKSIVGHEAEQDEMVMAARIALVCMSDVPHDRPSTDELVPMLSRLHSF